MVPESGIVLNDAMDDFSVKGKLFLTGSPSSQPGGQLTAALCLLVSLYKVEPTPLVISQPRQTTVRPLFRPFRIPPNPVEIKEKKAPS